jgi:hypothetical membrane protein
MNSVKPNGLIKLGGICGIIAPLIALACIGISAGLTTWFSWTDNYLSELAGPANSRNIAFTIFNIGLIIAGLLGMFFGWALWESRMLRKNLGKLAVVLLVLDMTGPSACSLCLPAHPMTYPPPHSSFCFLSSSS